jgi:hypothetical protein
MTTVDVGAISTGGSSPPKEEVGQFGWPMLLPGAAAQGNPTSIRSRGGGAGNTSEVAKSTSVR